MPPRSRLALVYPIGAQRHPMVVIPVLEMVNPLPDDTVQVTPSGLDVQVKGPTPAVWS